jgi:hypothetical protein
VRPYHPLKKKLSTSGKKIWRVSGTVVGGKFIGEYEADTGAEALTLAMEDLDVSLCHQCSSECEDPQITKLTAEHLRADGEFDVVEEEI